MTKAEVKTQLDAITDAARQAIVIRLERETHRPGAYIVKLDRLTHVAGIGLSILSTAETIRTVKTCIRLRTERDDDAYKQRVADFDWHDIDTNGTVSLLDPDAPALVDVMRRLTDPDFRQDLSDILKGYATEAFEVEKALFSEND